MKKLLVLATACLMATSVLAGGLDENTDTSTKTGLKSKLYTSVKLFGSLMTKEAEISGDYNAHTDYNDFRLGAGLTAGLRFDNIRTELEISHFGNTKDKSFYDQGGGRIYTKIKNMYNVMVNGYYDFKNETAFTPYIGAGLGLARIRGKVMADNGYESGFESKRTTNLAWQVGAGLAYKLNDKFDIDFGYRYLDNGSVKIREEDTKIKMKSHIHQIYTGLRFNF